jgi:hypothetical protein
MSVSVTFRERELFAIESPLPVTEGVSITLACTWWNTPSSVSAKVFKGTTDVTTTCMPTGSVSISGYVSSLKPITALVGGFKYVIAVTGTCNSDTHVKKIQLNVQKDEGKQ